MPCAASEHLVDRPNSYDQIAKQHQREDTYRLVCRCAFLNQRGLFEPLGAAVGATPILSSGGLSSSIVGLCSTCCSGVSSTCNTGFTSACCSGTPVACFAGGFVAYCSRTSSLLLGCSSMHVLHEAICMLGGGGTISSSSSDHSITAALRGRVVWSPPSDIPPGLRGVAVTVFLFFWAGSSAAACFPRDFSDNGGGGGPTV